VVAPVDRHEVPLGGVAGRLRARRGDAARARASARELRLARIGVQEGRLHLPAPRHRQLSYAARVF
jgi:hypothetical protein